MANLTLDFFDRQRVGVPLGIPRIDCVAEISISLSLRIYSSLTYLETSASIFQAVPEGMVFVMLTFQGKHDQKSIVRDFELRFKR